MRGKLYPVLPALIFCAAALTAQSGPGIPVKKLKPRPALTLLEPLLRIPPQMSVLQASSHNKKGVNSDAEWPLYKDERGDDVIFDASGPGCIKSMWGTAFDPERRSQVLFRRRPGAAA